MNLYIHNTNNEWHNVDYKVTIILIINYINMILIMNGTMLIINYINITLYPGERKKENIRYRQEQKITSC